jgi:IstB-like ATP binding protein
MLTHPTYSRLVALGLTGMAKALEEQSRQPDIAALDFEERLALLVDRETTDRENRRLVTRLQFASLRQNAVVEDVDLRTPRGLDKALFHKLAAGRWINQHHNLLIIVTTLTPSQPPDLMSMPKREQAPRGGRDDRNPRPASIGIDGRLRSEPPAEFVGIRTGRRGNRPPGTTTRPQELVARTSGGNAGDGKRGPAAENRQGGAPRGERPGHTGRAAPHQRGNWCATRRSAYPSIRGG